MRSAYQHPPGVARPAAQQITVDSNLCYAGPGISVRLTWVTWDAESSRDESGASGDFWSGSKAAPRDLLEELQKLSG